MQQLKPWLTKVVNTLCSSSRATGSFRVIWGTDTDFLTYITKILRSYLTTIWENSNNRVWKGGSWSSFPVPFSQESHIPHSFFITIPNSRFYIPEKYLTKYNFYNEGVDWPLRMMFVFFKDSCKNEIPFVPQYDAKSTIWESWPRSFPRGLYS